MPTRRQFLATAGSSLAATAVTSAQTPDPPLFSFGLMADCQYADIDTVGVRFYRESPRKLKEAIGELNKHDLAFTFHLGDWIDRDFKSFDLLEPIAATLQSKLYHALGNHDFEVEEAEKEKIPGKLGLEKGYYSFSRGGFRFIMIDTTEVSVYRHAQDDPRTKAARQELQGLDSACAKPWNGRPSSDQVAWLMVELKEAAEADEKVLVFGHHPILPDESHTIWNWREWHRLLNDHPCVKAYINGHNHAGAYTGATGLHYLTLDGMLNTEDQNAFAYAHLHSDRLELTGFGRQESHTLKFR